MANPIAISYSTVKREVRRLSEDIGLKAGGFDKLRVIDEDDEQLLYWYKEGLALVGNILDRIIKGKVLIVTSPAPTGMEVNDARITLSNLNDNESLLTDAIQKVLVSDIIVHWLKLVAPQLVDAYFVDLAHARDNLLRLAYFREMPK